MPITPEEVMKLAGKQEFQPVSPTGPVTADQILAISQDPNLAQQQPVRPVPATQPQTRQPSSPNAFQRGMKYGDEQQTQQWQERLGAINRTGVTPGTAMMGAATEIEMKNAERDANGLDRLSSRQTEAIMDNWKREGGRDDLSSTNQYEKIRRRLREQEGETLGGRFRQAGASAMSTIGQTAFGLIGTVAPEKAAEMRNEYQEVLNFDSSTWASKAGQLFGEGAKVLALAKTGPGGMAAIYGGQGFGSTRADVADMRAAGEDISLGEEFAAAAGIGTAEAVSGYVGGKLFGALGTHLKAMTPMLKTVMQGAGKAGVRKVVAQLLKAIVSQGGPATGAALAEGAEEAATQIVTNLIRQQTIDAEQGITEGVGEAAAFGAILSPFGAAGAVGAKADKNTELIEAILPHADGDQGIAEMVAAQVEGLMGEGAEIGLEEIGGMIESAKQILPGPDVSAEGEPGSIKSPERFDATREVTTRQPVGFAETVAPGIRNVPDTQKVKTTDTVQAAIQEISGTAGKPEVVEAVTAEQKEAVGVLDKLGIEAVLTKGGQYAGLTQDIGGKPVVFIDENLEGEGLRQAVSHEVSRALEIDKLPVAQKEVLKKYEGRYLARLEKEVKAGRISQEYLSEFKADPARQSQAGAALLIGEVFKSPTAFRRLSGQQPTLVQKIVDAFVGIKQKITGESAVIDRVLGAIDATMAKKAEISGLQAELDVAARESRENPLTGGLNRRAFDEMIKIGKDEGQPFSVIAFDAANLKAVNDKLGDAAGDAYLRDIMQKIQEATRGETEVRRADAFHYGGDEFAVIAWGASKKDAENILRRAEEQVGREEIVPGVSKFLVGSVSEHVPGSKKDILGEATRGLKARKILMKKEMGEAVTRQEAEAKVTEAAETEVKAAFLPKTAPPKLDPEQLRESLIQALQESPKVTGRPELASPGRTEKARRLVDVVDARLEQLGYPKPQTVKQWKREGKKIAANPERRAEIETALRTGTALESGSQTYAAIEIYNEAADKAMQTPTLKAIANAAQIATGYRLGRTETARVMRAGVDQMKTPAERMREFGRRSMTTPPSKVADAQRRHQEEQGWDPASGDPAPMSPQTKAWAEDVAKTVQKWKDDGLDPSKLDEAVSKSPRNQYRFLRDTQKIDAKHGTGFWSPIQEFYRNSIMSAPLTFIRNVTGGAHAVSDLLVVQPLRGAMESIIGGEKTSSLPASARAITAAMDPTVWARGLANAAMTLYYEQPIYDIQTQGIDPLKVDRPVAITGQGTAAALAKVGAPWVGKAVGKAVGVVGRGIRIPQLLNMAVDQIVKTIHGHATVAREAYLIGEKQNLEGELLEAFVSSQLADMGSPSWSAALATGDTDRVAFQADLGALSTVLVKAREAFPPLGLLFPFIKTPTNIFKEAFWATPGLGLVGLVGKGVTGKGNRAEYTSRGSQQLLGMMAMALLWNHIGGEDEEEPVITGPATYARKYRQERLGKQQVQPPMTVKIGDKRYSYRNIEPYSTIVGAMVAIVEEAKGSMKDGVSAADASKKVFSRLSAVYTDLPAIKAVGDLAKWLEDPEYYADRLWLTIGSGFMPNIYRSFDRASDDMIRESRVTGEPDERPSGATRMWRKMAPNGDHAAPPRVTIFGTQIRKDDATKLDGWASMMVHRMMNPFVERATPKGLEGDLLRMVVRWNEKNRGRKEQIRWFVEPSRTVQFKTGATVGSRREELNEKEWNLYMRLSGRMALSISTRQTWNFSNPTVRDITLLTRIMTKSRGTVRSALTSARKAKALSRPDEYNRIIGILEQRLASLENSI